MRDLFFSPFHHIQTDGGGMVFYEKSKSESKSNISKFDFVAKLNVMSCDVDMSIMVTTKVQSLELRFHCFILLTLMFTGGATVAADATAVVVIAMFRVLDFGSIFLFHCSSIYRRGKFMYLYHRLVFCLSFICSKKSSS